jgi:hypothetical protein
MYDFNTYKVEDDGAYKYEIVAPTYREAAQIAEIMGMGIRQWNWRPGDETLVKDKRPWESFYEST